MGNKAKEKSIHAQAEQLSGKEALLAWWEQQPAHVQFENHDYLRALRQQIRNIRNYILHRREVEFFDA